MTVSKEGKYLYDKLNHDDGWRCSESIVQASCIPYSSMNDTQLDFPGVCACGLFGNLHNAGRRIEKLANIVSKKFRLGPDATYLRIQELYRVGWETDRNKSTSAFNFIHLASRLC